MKFSVIIICVLKSVTFIPYEIVFCFFFIICHSTLGCNAISTIGFIKKLMFFYGMPFVCVWNHMITECFIA